MADLSILAASSCLLGGMSALLAWLLAGEAWASRLSWRGLSAVSRPSSALLCWASPSLAPAGSPPSCEGGGSGAAATNPAGRGSVRRRLRRRPSGPSSVQRRAWRMASSTAA